ncbi:MAG TPA: penicillin acylase family protein [Flavipsychrobacter sp.]|nr:penicillin acylase family protein [Flavipsychrobacter sp.]
MRLLQAVMIPLLTIAVVVLLNTPVGSLPALGKLLDPINGWAANAESASKNFSTEFSIKEIKQPVSVWMEERMVPHVHASNDHDLYFTQGYIHAYFRLWQMEFQTHAAAGRIGEIVGEKWVTDEKTKERKNAVLEFDRGQRRKGMVHGAENSLKSMTINPRTKEMLDAYTAGVNSYISSLRFKDYPIEYKLMGYAPEPWTNLKCALLLKTMADDLTGYTEDFPLTVLKDHLPKEEFEFLFPLRLKGSIPVIPEGTKFDAPSLTIPQAPGDSVWSRLPLTPSEGGGSASSSLPLENTTTKIQNSKFKTQIENTTTEIQNSKFKIQNSETGIGSNSWAISGTHTASGAPILCNDPHLGLNLPALWFEMQLQSDGMNVYGVSLPGAPGIIIGFNDSISWGFTNNYRDVKDFYEIEAIDKHFYRFDGKSRPFDKWIETIKIKGQPDFMDTVLYTLHGPVNYDESFPDPLRTGKMFAMQWMAHRGTNELLAIQMLNKAKDYAGFTEAIMHFQCPAQNIVYADRAGNIAMWGQGQFINKWKDQGRYVMKGNTSATMWRQNIPMAENPHVLNPPQGYLASANQITTDSTYPYWYNGYFHDFRAWRINEIFRGGMNAFDFTKTLENCSVEKMTLMQNDEQPFLQNSLEGFYSLAFSNSNHTRTISLITRQIDNFCGVTQNETVDNSIMTAFQVWWYFINETIWWDEFSALIFPKEERTMQLMLSDSTSNFYDDKTTSKKETFKDAIELSLQQTDDSLNKLEKSLGSLEWYKVKGTQLTHLAKLDAFSYKNLKIGGWGNTINAVKKTHGPSWRMIVEMGRDSITAYGVYPGGQSGNPGSKHYGTFVDHWVEGKYYQLAFLPNQERQSNKNIKYTWTIKPQ